jgi:hypothetical protein
VFRLIRYSGKGVTKAVENVNEIIAPEIVEGEFSVLDQVSNKSAAARATAIDTPKIAFAPNLPLLGVPSN